ncbi:3-deoxy-D-manno-octulosonic acid transferase [Acidocella sp.]|uniref:3-deoxy-D-manno-octulosonic acid transferase n=1 Tax=Acidocella sp. TaxID=50710 RepID=UPI002615C031|nr:glycosyltransferase N-terminal domain-containing protein [Acidocella sp.]
MILALYRLAAQAAAPWLRRHLAARAARGKEDPTRLPERQGHATRMRPPGRLIWLHAASVGETQSLLPLIAALSPRAGILLTTGTLTSAHLAAQRLPGNALHQFAPLDVPAWGARFLDHWRPDAAVFVESELWPNLLQGLDSRAIPRFLVNARLSEASARQWHRAPTTARRLLGGFRAIFAQSPADAARLTALGAANVEVAGNLKFVTPPLPADEAALAALRAALPGPCWLAASTHRGEEALAARIHAALLPEFPTLTTIIVPRHPERGAEIAAELPGSTRRALGQAPAPGGVHIADTLAELGLFYRLCPFTFMGKTMFEPGGHNIIEPALLACPIIAGPHLENFQEPAELLEKTGALVRVADEPALRAAVRAWLATPQAAAQAGQAAAACFAATSELPARLVRVILGA